MNSYEVKFMPNMKYAYLCYTHNYSIFKVCQSRNQSYEHDYLYIKKLDYCSKYIQQIL